MAKQKPKLEPWDDGRVIAPMSPQGRPKKVSQDTTKAERKAMTRALYAVLLPRLLLALSAFALTALLILLWLS